MSLKEERNIIFCTLVVGLFDRHEHQNLEIPTEERTYKVDVRDGVEIVPAPGHIITHLVLSVTCHLTLVTLHLSPTT